MTIDVSVVIAARNEELHVEEAVRSVLNQRGLSSELIFVDDNSTDRTIERARAAAGDAENFTLISNPNPGKNRAFNLGISLAKGDWVCIFSGDDIMPEDSLRARWDAVRNIVSDKPVIGTCRMITMSEVKSQDGAIVPKNPRKGSLSGSSFLVDRRAVELIFPAPETLPNEDTWMELHACYSQVRVVHSPVIGCAWRIHAGNSINLLGPFAEFEPKIRVRKEALSMFLESNGPSLTPEGRDELRARVRCEEARRRGSLLGIMTSGASFVEKMRAISQANAFLYGIRQRLYGLLSGW